MLGSSRSTDRRHEPSGVEGGLQLPAGRFGAAPPRGALAAGDSQQGRHRTMYSADESLSEEQMHEQHHTGSIQAWYKRGGASLREQASPAREHPDEWQQAGDQGLHAAPVRRYATGPLHGGAQGGMESEEEEGKGGEAGRGGSSEAEAVSWEANALFDFLKGLQELDRCARMPARSIHLWLHPEFRALHQAPAWLL